MTQGCMSDSDSSALTFDVEQRLANRLFVSGFPALEIGFLLHQAFPPSFLKGQRPFTLMHDGTDLRHGQIRYSCLRG